ncbi:MAG: IPT/TIG domain-containing protein [Candidatus Melainabacteria bacterium]|nr:IPT/TIG domain-containing protein [Candidatus Melainabacteria bacterium]
MSVITSKKRAALSVCVAISVSLVAPHQPADAKHKVSRHRSDNVQIAALPFFKKESGKDSTSKDAEKKNSEKTEAADVKKDKAQAAPVKESKADKKKAKETADATAKKADKPAVEAKAAAPVKTEAAAAEKAGDASAVATEEKAPTFAPDASLISVLKDLSKALRDPEQVQKLTEESNQQAVIAQAQNILSRSLENSELTFNRIISPDEERQASKELTPESWASGEINCAEATGSLTAVWAKRVNGLLNLTIAGKCKDKTAPNGKSIGNFVVVITGRSPIEAGFDIQTQSNVNFWLGQLASATIDSDCLSESASAEAAPAAGDENVKKKSLAALPILVTDRVVAYRRDITAYEARRKVLAQKAEEEQKEKDARTQMTAQAIAEATARVLKESTNRSLTKDETLKGTGDDSDDVIATAAKDVAAAKVESKEDSKAERNAKTEVSLKADVDKGAIKPASAARPKTEAPEIDSKAWSSPGDKVAMTVPPQRPEATRPPGSQSSSPPTNQSVWESPAGTPQSRQASLTATIVAPEKAVAGQFLTTAIIDKDKNGEPSVELSFNGAALATDSRGQALYMVPEDATPGRSLNISLGSRPELATNIVDILQPLTTSYEPQAPKIDRVSSMISPKSILVIEGHNFDGNASHNRILIDGLHEARIIAASPVQLKAMLPSGIGPGSHSLCVGNAGMRSNSATCDVIAAEVQQDPKELGRDNLSKLVIKVLGTNNRVNVRLTNNTPDVLRISRGNEMLVTTPGGSNNSVVVGVQRLKKGAYNVEAVIEQ